MLKRKQNKPRKTLNALGIFPIMEVPKGKTALKAREYMQTHYKRV